MRESAPHFGIPDPGPLRFLEIIAPGEFGAYLGELAAIFPSHGQPGPETQARPEELGAADDFESDPDGVPESLERYGLEMEFEGNRRANGLADVRG